MRKIIAVLILPFCILADDLPIGKYLNMIAEGKTEEVRAVMLDLYVENPDDPGVMLLAGAVLQDAFKAMDFYQKIVNDHPQSEWADDAMWRIIQFYAILGDEQKANAALEVMRKKYPTSQFLVPATDVVRSAVGLAAYKKENEAKLPNLDMPSGNNLTEDISKFATPNTQNKLKDEENRDGSISNEDANRMVKEIEQDFATIEQEYGKDDKSIAKMNEPTKRKTAQEILKEQIAKEKEKSSSPMVAEFEKPKQDNTSIELPDDKPKEITYGLQVAAFDSRDLAEGEQQKYLAQRMRTEILPKKVDGSIKFAVVIGAYSSKRSAEAAKIIVSRQCECEPLVIEK